MFADVNECENGPDSCDANHTYCINTLGSYYCQCKTGYTMNGEICEGIYKMFILYDKT